jgi:hypothetical protein
MSVLDWFWVSLHSLCCGESDYVAVIGLLVITVKLVCVIKSWKRWGQYKDVCQSNSSTSSLGIFVQPSIERLFMRGTIYELNSFHFWCGLMAHVSVVHYYILEVKPSAISMTFGLDNKQMTECSYSYIERQNVLPYFMDQQLCRHLKSRNGPLLVSYTWFQYRLVHSVMYAVAQYQDHDQKSISQIHLYSIHITFSLSILDCIYIPKPLHQQKLSWWPPRFKCHSGNSPAKWWFNSMIRPSGLSLCHISRGNGKLRGSIRMRASDQSRDLANKAQKELRDSFCRRCSAWQGNVDIL